MKSKISRIYVLTLIMTGCLLMSAGSALGYITETWEKDFDVKPGGNLYVESDLGAIYIETNSDNKVKIQVTARIDTRSENKAKDILEDFNIDFEQKGDDVTVFAEYKRRRSWSLWGNSNRNLRIEYYISVPREYNIDLYTAGGSIEVDDLTGEVRVETSGGSLHFEGINGPVEGKTSGGSISLESCTGDVDVKTSGGSISIGEVKGDVEAHTSGGSIQVDEVYGLLNAKTSGGSITARIEGQPDEECRLSTSGGSITVYLERDINVDIDAKTSAGYVDTDFPVTVRGKIRKSSLRGKINDGGPELYLRTSAGNININEI